jgi:anhydro-N-acetylmuramic acid kinase
MGELNVIGLMSGTSMDGVDAAFLRTDGEGRLQTGPALTLQYPEPFRAKLRSVMGRTAGDPGVAEVAAELTAYHAEAVRKLIGQHGLRDIDLVGFHGQTILHKPQERLTVQIGDGAWLAKELGLPVAYDFRSADVAAGGQGAPLVPLFHAALVADMELPLAVLNIGGVANVTWIGADRELLAFDTGPGNALIDDWVRQHTGQAHDAGGHLARAGTPDKARIAAALGHEFFTRRPPKSLDRNAFAAWAACQLRPGDRSPMHFAATLTDFTAAAVAEAVRHFPAAPKTWIVCGGGRLNDWLMERLAARLAPARVIQCDTLGWDGNALEAQAFAFLGVRVLKGLPLSLPSTTGVPHPMPGGKIARPG